jgi:hypothetical protein
VKTKLLQTLTKLFPALALLSLLLISPEALAAPLRVYEGFLIYGGGGPQRETFALVGDGLYITGGFGIGVTDSRPPAGGYFFAAGGTIDLSLIRQSSYNYDLGVRNIFLDGVKLSARRWEVGITSRSIRLQIPTEMRETLTLTAPFTMEGVVAGYPCDTEPRPCQPLHVVEFFGEGVVTVQLRKVTGFGVPGYLTVSITYHLSAGAGTANSIDGMEFFIRQQYVDFLNREPDATGFQNWLATLRDCPGGGFGEANPRCDRVHIAKSFYDSAEFANRGYFVYRFYEATLGRRPTYQEFNRDMEKIGGHRSPAETEGAKLDFIAEFLQKPEFTARYGGTTAPAQALLFIAKLEIFSGVQILEPARSQMIAQMQSGQQSTGETLRAFIENKALFDGFYNRGFVTMLYFGFLKRDPDTTGYDNWLQTLERTRDYRHLTHGFIYSTEYRRRFGLS